jgi:NCS1 family nucleobase:cation symporter-1
MATKGFPKKQFSNWSAQIKEDLRVEKGIGHEDGSNGRVWSNQDLDPTPPHKRTWRWHNYLLYFIGTGFNNWTGGSAVVGAGLGWQAAIAVAFITQSISGIVQAANSKSAARYHLGFPAIARSVYGMWGSSYQVAIRAILAAVWYATKCYEGASYLDIVMRCIFGHSYTNIPNTVPASIGYTTRDFLCYFLMWMIYTPFLFRRPYQMRNLFTVSCFASFPAVVGLFIYCVAKSGGKLGLAENEGSVKMSTSTTAWLVIYTMSSSISNGAAYIESVPDVARWASKPNAVIPPTLFCNLFYNPMSAVLGILGTSALQSAIGQTLWKPWDIMSYILDSHWTSGVRFGIFLLAFNWGYLSFAQNISSNMIPFGADMSMLWPKHLTMTRGYIIVHILAWCICPWKIYVSANTFLNFMGAYGIASTPFLRKTVPFLT